MDSNRMPLWHRSPSLRRHQHLDWDTQANCWISCGDQPTFVLTGQRPWCGWNMVELDMDGEILHGVASLTLKTRKGHHRVDMPLRPSKTAKRIVYLPPGVKKITLSLLGIHGKFYVQRFRWVWLSPLFAHDRLANRLGNLHPSYQGLSSKQVIRTLHQESVARGSGWRKVALDELNQTYSRACTRHDYQLWVDLVEHKFISKMKHPSRPEDLLSSRPCLSILIPLMPDAVEDRENFRKLLEFTFNSLVAQSYVHWELVVTLSKKIDSQALSVARKIVGGDDRVTLQLGDGGTLGQLSHLAFVQSKGDGVMWMTPGDRLAEDALQRVVEAWNRQPAAQLFYADEDELNNRGDRVRPLFKPEWNPDLLLSCNYVGRLALYKRRILWRLESYRDIGCFDHHLSANELDHVIVLRFLAWWYQVERERRSAIVCHLPRVLYHRCEPATAPGAASDVIGETDEQWPTYQVGEVQALLARLPVGEGAVVEPGMLPESVRVKWPLPVPPPLVSLLVPTRDGVDILKPCVDAILERTDYRHFELLILDNQSTCPETLAYMAEVEKRDARVRVLRWNQPFNYSAINNFGAEHAKGEIIGLINNDVEPIEEEWLTEMVSQVCRPEIGCVGAKLYYPNDTIQHGGVILGLGGVAGHAHRFFPSHEDGYAGRLKLVQNLSAVTAACLLLRKEVFEAVGGLNEADLSVAYNDVDLCLKVRELGYRNLWTPYAELYHHESISRGADDTPEKRARWLSEMDYMKRTWGKALHHDPAYNPNLTRVHEDFSLR